MHVSDLHMYISVHVPVCMCVFHVCMYVCVCANIHIFTCHVMSCHVMGAFHPGLGQRSSVQRAAVCARLLQNRYHLTRCRSFSVFDVRVLVMLVGYAHAKDFFNAWSGDHHQAFTYINFAFRLAKTREYEIIVYR